MFYKLIIAIQSAKGDGQMSSLDKARQIQIDNIQKKTGKSLDEIYSGARTSQRPIHEALMKHISKFGKFKTVPKKSYVRLRRKKQFTMINPKTNTRFEVGINAKDVKKNSRLLEQPRESMFNYIVNVTDAREVDPELIAWNKSAYESAG
jgi:hypothetical protein